MRKYNQLSVGNDEYQKFVGIQLYNKNKFQEHIFGSRKKLIVHNRIIATISPTNILDVDGLTEQEFVSFIAQFNKQLFKQFIKQPQLFDEQISFKGLARCKNVDYWTTLPINKMFYNVDLSSAYWQVAHKLGYINNKFYKKYLTNDKYKKAKRYCVTFLTRVNKMKYIDGVNIAEITCDTSSFKRVYDNIRYELYQTISKLAKELNNKYIEYNIDGISIDGADLQTVRDYFDRLGYEYKITLCMKKSNSEYLYGFSPKVFLKSLGD